MRLNQEQKMMAVEAYMDSQAPILLGWNDWPYDYFKGENEEGSATLSQSN